MKEGDSISDWSTSGTTVRTAVTSRFLVFYAGIAGSPITLIKTDEAK